MKTCTSFSIGIVGCIAFSSVSAETVQMVRDSLTSASWQIVSAAAPAENNDVVFHHQQNYPDSSDAIWRTTSDGTQQLDLTSIEEADPKDFKNFFVTKEHLYLFENGIYPENDRWQINFEGNEIQKVGMNESTFGFSLSSPIRDLRTSKTYFMAAFSLDGGLTPHVLDEQSPYINRLGTTIYPGHLWTTTAFLNNRILFTTNANLAVPGYNEGPWQSITTAGTGLQRLSVGGDITVGESLGYFSRGATRGGKFECGLWRTDSTSRGTFKLTDIFSSRSENTAAAKQFECQSDLIIVNGNRAIFRKINLSSRRIEIWRTDGSLANTRLLKQLPMYGPLESNNVSRIGGRIWFSLFNRAGRPVVWITDPTFRRLQRVMAGPTMSRVELIPTPGHMFVQFHDANGKSVMYKTDADGANRKRVLYGNAIGGKNQSEVVGNELVVPYKPAAKKPYEQLVSIDLDTGNRTVRQTWRDTTRSLFSQTTEIKKNTENDSYVYYCGRRIPGRNNSGARNLWRSDGTSTNTAPVIKDIVYYNQHESVPYSVEDYSQVPCGHYAIGPEKIYYTRDRAGSGAELWQANLNGTKPEMLVDAWTGPKSSSPRDIQVTPDGLVFVARTGNAIDEVSLLKTDFDGNLRILISDGSARIFKVIGDRVWFETTRAATGRRLLWTGENYGSRLQLINVDTSASSFTTKYVVDVEGETYVIGGHLRVDDKSVGLYKFDDSTDKLELITGFEIQSLIDGRYIRDGFSALDRIDQVAEFDEKILFLKRGGIFGSLNTDPSPYDELRQIDPQSGAEITLFSTNDRKKKIASFTVFNGAIYFYVYRERIIDSRTTRAAWEMWRSSGQPGDAVQVFQQNMNSMTRHQDGKLTSTAQAIWFAARDTQHGSELWQLKP